MEPINTQWFVDSLNDKRMSQRGLAKLLGCDPSSVHRLLTGKRPMRLDEAEQLSTLLGKTVGEVLGHAGVPLDSAQTVPVCGHLDMVLEAHLELDRVDIERVAGLAGSPPETYALRAMTEGSAYHLFDGWLFYVAPPTPHAAIQAADVLDRLCLVRIENGPRLIRWLRRGYRAGTWNLDSLIDATRVRDAVLASAVPVLGMRQV